MTNFPRRGGNNGYDNGAEVGTKSKCPNCDSPKYIQTISTESCSNCGLFFDYWAVNGTHGNEVYDAMIERQRQAEAWADYERQRELEKEYEYLDDEYDCSGGW